MPPDVPGGIRDGVRRLFRLALHRPDIARRDMDDELRFHLDVRTEQLVARGMCRDDARAEAERRIGGAVDAARRHLHQSAETRERRLAMSEHINELLHDIRYAVRGLAHGNRKTR